MSHIKKIPCLDEHYADKQGNIYKRISHTGTTAAGYLQLRVKYIKDNLNIYSNSYLAKVYNVNPSVISNIRHGKNWRHV